MSNKPFTQVEVKSFASQWYQMLDVHASLEDYRPLLAGDQLVLRFPEGTFYGFNGFCEWYNNVIQLFFDEVHTVKRLILPSPPPDASRDHLVVQIVVRWEASIWKPPAAKSERIVLDAYQTWTIGCSVPDGRPIIVMYVVDRLDYAEGSARL
jgi:hypothetical protein